MTTENQAVAVPSKETALQVYSATNGLDPFLQKIREEIDCFVPDVTTRKGREAIASIAYKVARSKTALDNVGKELVAELKEVPKKIDAERKRMRDLLESWQEEVRKPLTDWEQAEADRVARIQAQVAKLADTDVTDMTAVDIKASIDNLEAHVIDARYEEFEAEAHRVKASSLAALREAMEKQEKHEAEQAELAELRRKQAEQEQKDREARIAQEAAEKAQREAEAKAQAERDAAAHRERELELQAERAKRAELEAQQRADQAERDAQRRAEEAAAAERKRQAEEVARIESEAKAREADKAHKKAINNTALAAFIDGGMTEECAKLAVTLIAKRAIPNIAIQY